MKDTRLSWAVQRCSVLALILGAITSIGLVNAYHPQKSNPEKSTEYNSKGELVDVEKTYDNDHRLLERKESDPTTGKVRKRITYKYLKGFKEPNTSETRYGPDGTTVTGTTNIDHDKDGQPTSTSTTEYNAAGKETGGSKRERDSATGKERCYNWNSTKQAYEEVQCTGPWVSGLSMNDSAPSKNGDGQVIANGGLETLVFDASAGKLRINLPDDMRAGDTISGTVVLEPKGDSSEEKEKNRATLEGYVIDVGGKSVSARQDRFTIQPVFDMVPPEASVGQTQRVLISIRNTAAGANSPPATSVINFPTIDVPNPNQAQTFLLPPLGQQGRPTEIFGPFDGNAENTTVRFGPVGSTVPDFEKNTENVSGGFGLIRPLAESPRKIVVESPTNVVGPIQVFVNEGDKKTTGAYRNLGVNLTAPTTNLQRGQRTTVTVEVRGLEGITKDVPLQLNSKGVITMEGGNVQNLRIKPQEVRQDGHYTTGREITGQQTGGFTVTATVIVRPFDFCIQDDNRPSIVVLLNAVTGDYIFGCPGCASPQSGTEKPPGQAGSSQPGTLTGTGKTAMKGCIITLTHNAPDRRIFATLDACTRTGEASVESRKTRFTIKDSDTTNNTCGSPAPPR
jgi:hypothetical protein